VSENGRWLQIKALFEQSQQQPEAERETWLAGQCANDRDLLRAVLDLLSAQRAAPGIFDGGAAGVLERLHDDEPVADLVGQRVGAYRLLRLVGEGGMGCVYLAEREDGDFAQRAALKLIRAEFMSDEARMRFVRERKILAGLQHPHIAQLHDGGVADDGTPYFTLEYIEGQPINKYCDACALDIRRRVAIVLQVCAAVAYAHRNLIVHRDLKPSNILVTADGEVKLLDFGIAKLLDADTGEGKSATLARMMTPEYAAPEQVLGEPITTATDVYAIGVLLYELLCGRLPYARADAGAISWAKAVVEEAPESFNRALVREAGTTQRPTGETAAAARGMTLPTLRRALRGDLDRIVQRALAKEPDARYPSVIAIADDLRAFVDGRAISGGSRRYRMRKFVRRHWLPLVAAATVALVLLASVAVIIWEARQTQHQAQRTLAVSDFLYGLFTAVNPHEAKGREVSARELLDRGAEHIDDNTALDAEQKAEIEAMLGRIYFQLGLNEQASKLQERAIKVLSLDSSQSLLLVRTEIERAQALLRVPDHEAAAALAQDARHRIETLADATISDRAAVAYAQADAAIAQGNLSEAKRYADEDLALARKTTDTNPRLLFQALLMSGYASWANSHFEEAESLYREALAIGSGKTGPDDLDVAYAQVFLAKILNAQWRYAEAKQFQEQALAKIEKALGRDNRQTTLALRDLGLSNYYLGNYSQARSILEQGIAALRKSGSANDHLIPTMEISLGTLLVESGDPDAAEQVLTDVIGTYNKTAEDKMLAYLATGALAAAHTAQGKLDQAQMELAGLLEYEEKNQAHGGGIDDRCRLGDVKRLLGDTTSAIQLQSAALAASLKAYGENNPHTANVHEFLAISLRDSGNGGAAEREFRAALASYAGYIPQAEHPLAATTRYELGLLLVQRDETRVEGIRLLAEAVALREKFFGKNESHTKQARAALERAQKPAMP
jgi:serine/threonine-protein kinase